VSGNELNIPSVTLFGPVTGALVMAIPEIEARTGHSVTLVGGLAVLCRLSRAYRATSDVERQTTEPKMSLVSSKCLLTLEPNRGGPPGFEFRLLGGRYG
jgi:hypothetical protein